MRARLRIIAMLAAAISCAGAGTVPSDQPRSASSDACWHDRNPDKAIAACSRIVELTTR
jgi:hypothetical protein